MVGNVKSFEPRPTGWYALPLLLFFGFFALLPLILVAYLSFTDYDPLLAPEFTGLANWERLADDSQAWDALRRTGILAALCLLIQTPIAMLIGVWSAGPERNRAVLSSLFFLPLLLSTAAVATLWRRLLDPNFGATGVLPGALGEFNFLGTEFALFAVVVVMSWQWIPFHTLLFQGAARQIPQVLYEAATIDGAGRVRQFFAITLPQLRYTIVTSAILNLVGSLTAFDLVLILTNGGGPGTASRILALHMYISGFSSYEAGYASAIALMLVVLGAAVSLLMAGVTGFRKMASQQEGL